MPALKKNPEQVKSKTINVRITEQEQKALQEWNQRVKTSPTTNDRINISELIRETLIKAITEK